MTLQFAYYALFTVLIPGFGFYCTRIVWREDWSLTPWNLLAFASLTVHFAQQTLEHWPT
jgi:hypothetical protein